MLLATDVYTFKLQAISISSLTSTRAAKLTATSIPSYNAPHRKNTMEEDRLWKFRRPEWLNRVWARNSGVYASGALVRFALRFRLQQRIFAIVDSRHLNSRGLVNKCLNVLTSIGFCAVLDRLLRYARCRCLVQVLQERFRRAR